MTPIALLAPEAVLISIDGVVVVVVVVTVLIVGAVVPLFNPVAVAPDALAMTTMPAELVEFKSTPER